MKHKMLMYKIGGRMRQVQLYPVCYTYNRSLGIYLCKKGGDIDDEDALEITGCLDALQAKNCVYIDVNNCGTDIMVWLEKNSLGKATGRKAKFGFLSYQEFMFYEDTLQEYSNEYYEQYLKWREKQDGYKEFLLQSSAMREEVYPMIISKQLAAQYCEYQNGALYLKQDCSPELSGGERGSSVHEQGMCDSSFKKRT